MRAHAKPRPLPVRLAQAASRHPVRTLRRGQSRAVDRWGIGLGGVLVTCAVLAVTGWIVAVLSAL